MRCSTAPQSYFEFFFSIKRRALIFAFVSLVLMHFSLASLSARSLGSRREFLGAGLLVNNF